MGTELLKEIKDVLSTFPEYWEDELLLKTKVIEDMREYRADLIETLFSNEKVKEAYSIKIRDGLLFKVDEFIAMLRFKNYWENSYTRFSNEIGLASEGKYLRYDSDVVLEFPFKDCVLEGGMTKEDVGKKEVYYHNVLAREEIDIMLSPKVLTNIKKHDKHGEHEVTNIDDNDNLIVKGNNLIALHSLKERYAGKVKLIYIDPPYNTGGDSFKYNDRFNHSTWLIFMKNRLEIACEFLEDGGSIWINIDDNEAHYLKVMMDSILPNGFVADVIWQKRTSPDARATIGDAHDHILVYTNNKEAFKVNPLPLSDEQRARFKNPDDDPRGPWVSTDFTAQGYRPNQMYKIITPAGKEYTPSPGNCWKRIESEYIKLKEEGRMWFGKNGDAMPRRKTYLSESPGVVAWTWWPNKEVGHNQEAKKESIALFGKNNPFSTPKPERLLQRIIMLCTDERDIVMDFFAGSGTTAAVAHKLNRHYISIEQMTYEIDYTSERMKKVIEGEQGGISREVSWKGGGSFIYAELQELNMKYISMIQDSTKDADLKIVMRNMNESAYLNFKTDIQKATNKNSGFQELSFDEKKRLLINVLDANQLYLSYSEIDDAKFEVPESIKAFNRSFYAKDGENE
ncbi:cytosine methyltransferase [Sporosarcina sp. P37]|uniref:site-specific DNA-methyltransferase n=1 Tax=unclassified Sporosarcina TaxID=2647733 RepID=UPI000A17C3B2|nr:MULTISPECIES: site-specific DNA-methyltransferase [unclassified Sporosarcina]ARK25598.1 cytosine methyltransferase [Sporosarcina sp. P37]PID17314.1 cytosine methyltransferase [Sporosarcina sp. P35]